MNEILKWIDERINELDVCLKGSNEIHERHCLRMMLGEVREMKEIILSEQKEPCELCNWFKGMKAPIPEIESELGEEIIYKSKEINCCPNCGRQLNQPYTE
jgi:hypothetical protein